MVNGERLSLPVLDLEGCAGLKFRPNCWACAMPPIDFERNEVELLQKRAYAKRHTWLSAGAVLGAGENVGLQPGDWALVMPKWAKRVAGLVTPDLVMREEIWFFGISSPFVGGSVDIDPTHTVFGLVGTQDGPRPEVWADEDQVIEPVGPRVMDAIDRWDGKSKLVGRIRVHLTPKLAMRNGLHVPELARDRPDMALVEACSPACTFCRPGDLIIYQRRGISNLYPAGDRERAYLPETAVFCKVLQ